MAGEYVNPSQLADQENLQKFLQGLNQNFQNARDRQHQSEMQSSSQAAQSALSSQNAGQEQGLQQFIMGLKDQEREKNLKEAQNIVDNNARTGRKVSAKVGDVDVSQQETSPLAKIGQYGKAVDSAATKTFKPYDDQLDAARSTLESLDLGNAQSDKMALINEARIAAGTSASRALKGIMDALSGGKTAGMDYQSTLNYLANTPESSVMQPGQRNALREVVFSRINQLGNQVSLTHDQFKSRVPMLNPYDPNPDGTTSVYTSPLRQKLADLQQRQQAYKQGQQQSQNPPVSQPSTYTDTDQGGLMGFLKKGLDKVNPFSSSPASAPAQVAPAGVQGVPSFEDFKKMKASGQIK